MVHGPIDREKDPVSPVMLARGQMVYWARRYLGSRKWNENSLYDTSYEGGGTLTLNPAKWDSRQWLTGYACNLFVADICELAGTKTWKDVVKEGHSINRLGYWREPTVKEWNDAAFKLRGWKVVAQNGLPQLGDVAISATHMGIVSGDGKLISASSREGKVNEVEWGEMSSAIKRRFIGLTQEDIDAMAAEKKMLEQTEALQSEALNEDRVFKL